MRTTTNLLKDYLKPLFHFLNEVDVAGLEIGRTRITPSKKVVDYKLIYSSEEARVDAGFFTFANDINLDDCLFTLASNVLNMYPNYITNGGTDACWISSLGFLFDHEPTFLTTPSVELTLIFKGTKVL